MLTTVDNTIFTARKRSAFTLIELLVVIGILALLAAILIPVFFSAREKSRAATCTASLKQIGSAMAMYVSDYDGAYPPVDTGVLVDDAFGGSSWCWFDLIGVYAGHTLPPHGSDPLNLPFAPCPDSADITVEEYKYDRGIGYAYNYNLAPIQDVTEHTAISQGEQESIVRYPALTITACDARAARIATNAVEVRTDTGQVPGGLRHQGAGNYLFADGHVRRMAAKEITITGNMPGDGIHPGFGL